MKISFSKYQGTGNDFIIIDNRLIHWRPTVNEVAMLCNRHFGIGADGLMLLESRMGYDFAMTYFNSDGNESTMCGNGGRCMSAYARSLGLMGDTAHFWAVDGAHESGIIAEASPGNYKLKMKDTRIGTKYEDGLSIDTGSPHFVVFVNDILQVDVVGSGRALRNDARFAPGGTNVDFVQMKPDGIFVRTYERGVEDETLSCGTGVTASSLVAAYLDRGNKTSYKVKTLGGDLEVRFVRHGEDFTEIWLEGPAGFVFSGEIEI